MYRSSLLILLPLFFSFSVHAEEEVNDVSDIKLRTWLLDYLTVGASLTAGIGGRSIVVDVTRQGTNDHGKIIENKANELFLLYSTRASYFGGSNVGYAWLFDLSTIHLNEQELSNKDTINLGTQVDGYFATVVPTVFYNIGDRYRGHYLRTGIGIGAGIAKFDGDVFLTESAQADDHVTISNGASNVFFSLGVFIDYQWKNFALRLSTSGPNLDYDSYDINVSGTSLVFGYTYYL